MKIVSYMTIYFLLLFAFKKHIILLLFLMRVHPKLSLLISVGEDTDRNPAVVGVLTDHLLLRQFMMHPLMPCSQ